MTEKLFGVLIRVSTDMQATDGDSIEMQTNMANALIKELGGTLVKVYLEEGVSASKTRMKDRIKLMECISDIRSGTINNLIAYRRDRIARNTEESIVIRNILKDNSCQLHFTARGESQFDMDDPYAMLMENVRASLDEIESIQTSIRVSDTMLDKARRGEFSGGNLPYGYQNENGIIKPIETEVEKIKEIVGLYLQGYGIQSIARYLNHEEVRGLGKRHSPMEKLVLNRKIQSSLWTKDTVKGILFNSIYSGYLEYTSKVGNKKETVREKSSQVIPIRTEEEQLEINQLRNRKVDVKKSPTRYNTPFLLTGILQCEVCGSYYKGTTSQRKDGTRYSYYKCVGKQSVHGKMCNNKSYKKELIESYVLMHVKKVMMDIASSNSHKFIQKGLENNKSLLENQLSEVNNSLVKKKKDFDSIRELILELPRDDMYEMMRDMYLEDQKSIMREMQSLKVKQAELSNELEDSGGQVVDLEYIISTSKKFADIIEHCEFAEKKKIVDQLFSSISINVNGDITCKVAIGKESSFGVQLIQVGGVGDTTTSQYINQKQEQTFLESNINNSIQSALESIRNNLLPFIFHNNPTIPKTIKGFAEATGISEGSYKLYKSGNITPSLKNLNLLINVSNRTIDDFVEYTNKKSRHALTKEFILESLVALDTRESYIFSRKIKCSSCNATFLSRRKGHSLNVYYVCGSINKSFCGARKIEEVELLRNIRAHTGILFDEQMVKNYIKEILVFENGDYTIYFKANCEYKTINVKNNNLNKKVN